MVVSDAQFQRSKPDSPSGTPVKRVLIDGATALSKFVSGSGVQDMTGAEFFAIVGHIKENHPGGNELEIDLMKVKRHADKKRHLQNWIEENIRSTNAQLELQQHLSVVAPLERASSARGDLDRGTLQQKHDSSTQPLLERNSSAPALLAMQDVTDTMNEFAAGKDHLQMNGREYHGIVAWLKAHGHSDVEDNLMRVKLLGDKKYHLVKYVKEFLSDRLRNSEIVELPPHQRELSTSLTTPRVDSFEVPHAAPAEYLRETSCVTSWQANDVRAVAAQNVIALEQTIQRMEESFRFAVECMQNDMLHAREQLRVLRTALQE